MVAPARVVAHKVLMRVLGDEAWAERALNAALSRGRLSPRDRALVTELVYGTLRHQGYIDFLLGHFVKRPLRKLPLATLAAIRMGGYQIIGTRVPDYSAVNDTVSLVRERHRHLAGLANAVLRKVAVAQAEGSLPAPEDAFDDPMAALAVRASHPLWLVEHVAAMRGEQAARAWVEANNAKPPIALRVNRLRATREAVAEELRASGVEVEVPELFPDGLLISSAGRIDALPGFAQGHFTVQDLAAQLIGRMAAPRSGDVVLDSCAAPGGKTTHLAELMRDEGEVLAVDVHRAKTGLITEAVERLGLTSVSMRAVDATDPDALAEALESIDSPTVDVAVVDGPCSGAGTLRRNPELRQRIEEDLTWLCRQQDQLLDTVSRFVKPGGALIYVVCTITREEGEERVEAFLQRHADYRLETPDDPVLRPFLRPLGDAMVLETWTDLHGTDSFFAARLVRAT